MGKAALIRAVAQVLQSIHPFILATCVRVQAAIKQMEASERPVLPPVRLSNDPCAMGTRPPSAEFDSNDNLVVGFRVGTSRVVNIPVYSVKRSVLADGGEVHCEILQEPTAFPVVLCTGHVFDATSVKFWLRRHDTCPVSRGVCVCVCVCALRDTP